MGCTEEEWKELKAKELSGKVDWLIQRVAQIDLKISEIQDWKRGQVLINRSLKAEMIEVKKELAKLKGGK